MHSYHGDEHNKNLGLSDTSVDNNLSNGTADSPVRLYYHLIRVSLRQNII